MTPGIHQAGGPPDLAGAVEEIRRRGLARPGEGPELLLVLGSGLRGVLGALDDSRSVALADLPGFPAATVEGHSGVLHFGEMGGRRVLLQVGRYHFYEGYGAETVVAPVRLAVRLGVRGILVTNAAGGIGREMDVGEIMVIEDHINLQWRSVLAGPEREGEVRFPDMSAPYDPELQALLERTALSRGIRLQRGTYAAVLGPNYETPAEIRMLERLGAHAVGMSTVPEVTVARASGVPVLGLSLVTNRAAGLAAGTLSHDEVVEVGRAASDRLVELIRDLVRQWPSSQDAGAK